MEVFCEETQKPKPRDLVLVDFQTLELYAIQEHNAGYFIRDYYVEIESEEDGVEVKAFYCPKQLRNSERKELFRLMFRDIREEEATQNW